MNILLIVAAGAFLLLVAGRTYPFWIAKVFGQNDDNPPPSQRFADGKEYVKTPTQVVFAHHFASIAGAGPIVGPILALAFGWGPAWLWIILGAIFYGAVHDMTAMFVSVREGGKTIAEIARRTLGTTGFLLFVVFLILVLCLINAIFLNLSAVALTSLIPVDQLGVDPQHTLLKLLPADANGVIKAKIGGIATTSVFVMTAFAPLVGFLVHRRGLRGFPAFGLAAVICVASVIIGFAYPLDLYSLIGSLFPQDNPGRTMDLAQITWRWVLAGYVFVGCWIPVWLILQPRDF
ncbi:MAG: carbon starvation protein A, partial [Planctomycetes bacterium]|nr:carbon starvation protein A [Planctomycetota bacterium]